jgi:hypothetical protein
MAFNPDREYDRQNRMQDNNPEYNNDKPDTAAYQRARLAALLQMTYVGAPLVYYGDEAGMWGADDPSNRKPMLWEDLEPYAKPEDQPRDGRAPRVLPRDHRAAQRARRAADRWVRVAVGRLPLPAGSPADWTHVFGGDGTVSAQGDRLTLTIPPLSGAVLQAAR